MDAATRGRFTRNATKDQIKPLEQITNGIVSFLSGQHNIPTCEDHQEFDSNVFM